MATSPAIEVLVNRWVKRLQNVSDRLQRCRVTIDQPHHHQRRGAEFLVKIELAVPGSELVVAREQGNADVHVAIAEAFDAARRQLLDHAQIRRGEVKTHVA